MRHLLLALGFLVGLTSMGCGDDDADTAKDPVPVEGLKTTRSQACLDTQKAACDLLAKCNAPEQAATCASFQSYYCKTDAAAQACSAAIAKAECSQLGGGIAECQLEVLADVENARTNCRGMSTELCNFRRRCNSSDGGDACQAEAEASQKCSTVFGNSPSFAQCLTELRVAECGTPVPTSCNGVNISPK